MAGQNVSGWYKDAEGVWHELETGGSTGCGGGWYQDAEGVWHEEVEEVAAEVTATEETAEAVVGEVGEMAEVAVVEEVAAEVTAVSEVAESREVQGSLPQAHGYALVLPTALGMPISGLPSSGLNDPAALELALVVPEVVVPECATCLGALLNGGMGCTPHFVPGKVHFQT